jgi:integrase
LEASNGSTLKTASALCPPEVVKNSRTHFFPLGTMAQEIITKIPRTNSYLFPGRDENPVFAGWSKSKRALDKLCPLPQWQLHDLRRTWTVMNAQWTLPHVLERILNHSSGIISGVAGVYNRYAYMEEMRQAFSQWEKHLAKQLKQE